MLELDVITNYTGKYERRKSMRGVEYAVWNLPMPRIEDKILDCVIYLYPSEVDARNGERAGGSGFLVGIPSKVYKQAHYVYAVTNSHVIKEGNSPVIRMNTKEGQTDVLNLKPIDWIHHPDGDDVAVCPVAFPPDRFKFSHIGQDLFLTKDIIREEGIGPGDDVYLVGRFVSHEGKQRNIPSVRFGNIAMMPWEPIRHKTRGIMVESYLVEAHSIAGYSGSPVFIHIPPMSVRPDKDGIDSTYRRWLLGLDWGHFINRETVKEKTAPDEPDREVAEGWWVYYNTGMMMVVPSWKMMDVLNLDVLKAPRDENDRKLAEERGLSDIQLD